MFPTPECEKYWTSDRVREVPFYIDYLDPAFAAYLDCLGEDPDTFFEKYVALVTTGTAPRGREPRLGYAHPTGGRVHVAELPEPFLDPDFGTPALEMDSKGILYTGAGYRNDRSGLILPYHQEIMRLAGDHNRQLRGPHDLDTARADRAMQTKARSLGIWAPLTVAIIVPEKLVFAGKLADPEKIKRQFSVPGERTFAIQFRIYPGTSTRIDDLYGFAYHHMPDRITDNDLQNLLNQLFRAQALFQKVELPRLRQIWPDETAANIFNRFSGILINNVSLCLKNKFTPPSGAETDAGLSHWHLQNFTTSGVVAEFSPLTDYPKLTNSDRINHTADILEAAYEAWVAMTIATNISSVDMIPPFSDFLKNFSDIPDAMKAAGLYDFDKSRCVKLRSDRAGYYLHWLKTQGRHIQIPIRL